jgi:multidrug efflux pump subunit AcrA (membrane-fusion protein)
MKAKMFFPVLVVLIISAGSAWIATHHSPASTADASGREALYYTCSMHPWVREHKPGPCPVCGMNLTPVYESAGGASAAGSSTNSSPGMVTLEPESISTINVQTDLVARRHVRHTVHLAGEIIGNSPQAAWFEFTVYERDLPWLKIGQTLEVVVSSAPGKIYTAQIKLNGTKPYVDTNFDMMSGSTKVRAEISNPPVTGGNLGAQELFNGLHAESHLASETEETLTVPRSAVISRGIGPMVYVDTGNGHYAPCEVLLGRVGNELVEILGGLKAGEKVVTNGNVLIDSEAQLTVSE